MALHIMSGIPGSGKSTFAWERLRPDYHATILEPDAFRKEMTGQYHFPAIEDFVWANVKMTARVLLKSAQSVIIDATALTSYRRNEWIRIAKECEVTSYCWSFITSAFLCDERNQNRNRTVPTEVLNRQKSQFTIPTMGEGFTEIRLVSADSRDFTVVGYVREQDMATMTGNFRQLTGRKYYDELSWMENQRMDWRPRDGK